MSIADVTSKNHAEFSYEPISAPGFDDPSINLLKLQKLLINGSLISKMLWIRRMSIGSSTRSTMTGGGVTCSLLTKPTLTL